MDYIRAIERQQIREDIPAVKVGDNVKVHYRIIEGDRQREQIFQGDVIHCAVRRAKLYYLRDRVGKAARIPEKR